MRRVSIVGNSGSGKSTLGRALAARLDVPFVELDGFAHQPGWTLLPDDEFAARIDSATRGDGWVVDGNYSRFLDLVWGRADTVVWFDLPRLTATRRIVTRTLHRMLTRQVLWNGNRERLRAVLSRDPHVNIVLWSVSHQAVYRERYARLSRDPAWAHLTFVRIGSTADSRRLLAAASDPASDSASESASESESESS
jgi:adenylate kinase family enzyme